MNTDTIFAIDGGGTNCRGTLFAPDGSILVEVRSGPCNPTNNLDQALASLKDLIAAACQQAGITPGDLAGSSLALASAGLVRKDRRRAFLDRLPRFAKRHVMTDGYGALVGAGGGEPCGLIVCGTGSAGHRLYPDGRSIQIGGWGYLASDHGAGAWIGRQALEAFLLVRDALGEGGPMSDAIGQIVGGTDTDILTWLGAAHAAELGSLAPTVFDAAENGDPAARSILSRAASHLADMIGVLDLPADDPIYIVGSVGQRLRPLISQIRDRELLEPQASALYGAYWVALGRAPSDLDD